MLTDWRQLAYPIHMGGPLLLLLCCTADGEVVVEVLSTQAKGEREYFNFIPCRMPRMPVKAFLSHGEPI
jgi:hypothetical protein